jgi:hypothetical protein
MRCKNSGIFIRERASRLMPSRTRRGTRRQISLIAPRFGPERLVVSGQLLFEGTPVVRNNPLIAQLLPRLLYQLVPAALVTTVGVLLLSNLAKVSDAPPAAAPVETAINTEAVFKAVPREPSAEPAQDSKSVKVAAPRAASPKPQASSPQPSRKPANEPAMPRQVASAPAPLPIVQIAEQPQPAAATPDDENSVMSRLRSATTAVQRIPQWAAHSVAGWFSADAPPPRPPASVPEQNFQAAM